LWCRTQFLIAGQSRVCSSGSFALFVADAWKTALPYAAKVSYYHNILQNIKFIVQSIL